MRICRECGNTTTDDASFCNVCGARLSDIIGQDTVRFDDGGENQDIDNEALPLEEGPAEYQFNPEDANTNEEITDSTEQMGSDKNASATEAYQCKMLVRLLERTAFNKVLAATLVLLSVIAVVIFVKTKTASLDADSRGSYSTEDVLPAYDETQQDATDTTAETGSEDSKMNEDAMTEPIHGSNEAFYGIWCTAYAAAEDAENFVRSMKEHNLNGEVIITSEWENLNPVRYYVVTAGRYYSESEADSKLSEVRTYYPDAYIKYTGAMLGKDPNDNEGDYSDTEYKYPRQDGERVMAEDFTEWYNGYWIDLDSYADYLNGDSGNYSYILFENGRIQQVWWPTSAMGEITDVVMVQDMYENEKFHYTITIHYDATEETNEHTDTMTVVIRGNEMYIPNSDSGLYKNMGNDLDEAFENAEADIRQYR